jgi:predicted component of type VI protein secretion system
MSEHKVSVVLRMPGGKTLADEGTLARESDGRSERYAVARPGAGMWEAVVSGRDLPADGVLVDLSFVTTPLVYAYGVGPAEASGPATTPVSAEEIATPAPQESETPTPTPTPTPTRRPRATVAPTNTPTPAATLPKVTQTPSR